jgi:hypothetical protein
MMRRQRCASSSPTRSYCFSQDAQELALSARDLADLIEEGVPRGRFEPPANFDGASKAPLMGPKNSLS